MLHTHTGRHAGTQSVTLTHTGSARNIHSQKYSKANDRQMATRRVVKRLLAAKYFCYFNKMNALISVIIRQPLESAKAVGRGSKTRGSGRNGLGAVLALVSHFRGPSAFYLLPSKAALDSR